MRRTLPTRVARTSRRRLLTSLLLVVPAVLDLALPASAENEARAAPQPSTHPASVMPPPLPEKPPARRRRERLSAVTSWLYQLRRIDASAIAASNADLVVVDYAPDRIHGVELPFTRADVAAMQRKPDGSPRLVLAYLSIGEAERYRTYWNNAWYDVATRPAWLLDVNKAWDGNFPVRFWHPEWQAIIYGTPGAYLDRILAAGFDGIYLDRADVFQELAGENAAADREMARFISRLSAYARRIDPLALVVMQNAEELVQRPEVLSAIDAIAKEDLFHGVEHDEARNDPDMIRHSLADLRFAEARGLRILVVEYLSDAAAARRAVDEARSLRFLPLIAERSLGTLEYAPAAGTPAPTSPIGDAAPVPADPTTR